MDQRKQDIVRLVARIGETISRWEEGENPSLLEVDVVKSLIRELYSTVDLLQEKPVPEVKSEPVQKSDAAEAVKLKHEPEVKPDTAEAAKVKPKPEVKPDTAGPETVSDEPEKKPAPSAAAAVKPESKEQPTPDELPGNDKKPEIPDSAEAIEETPVSGQSNSKTTLADRFLDDKRFINESYAQESKRKGLGEKIQAKPISSINKSLGINDRFKIMNELFNGDKESFEKTITILDDSANFNEAFEYLNTSFNWDAEDESVQFLFDLVRRKFIVSQHE